MLPANDTARHAVEWLFDPQYADTHLMQVAYALITFSADDTEMAEKMQIWVGDFAEKLTRLIADDYPQSAPEKITAVSQRHHGHLFQR